MITDTAEYRNKMYHRPGDTADRLDYEKNGSCRARRQKGA